MRWDMDFLIIFLCFSSLLKKRRMIIMRLFLKKINNYFAVLCRKTKRKKRHIIKIEELKRTMYPFF